MPLGGNFHLPGSSKKSQGARGEREGDGGERRAGSTGKAPPVAMGGGEGGDPPKGSWGQTHMQRLSNVAAISFFEGKERGCL